VKVALKQILCSGQEFIFCHQSVLEKEVSYEMTKDDHYKQVAHNVFLS
jgi:hypothetical protein